MKYLTAITALLVVLFGGIYLSTALYVAKTTELDNKTHSDVILVLGAKAYRDNRYNPCLVSRVQHAVNLYKAKYASKLLFSGGVDKEDNISEANTMKKIAMSLGVPTNDILLESASTSTYENFLFAQKILQSNHLRSVIIVTEAFHSPRAALIAKKLNMNFTVSPVTTSVCWLPRKYFSGYFLKEPLAIMVYKIKNKL